MSHPPTKPLGQFLATSIAGNDLLSSVLYTAGICVQYSGKLAPVALLLVSVMLYFFRALYSEVVTAMPVNGGSYNALLNTTSKRAAALASCLSMLSYVATAVVSAYSAVAYVQPLWPWAGTPTGAAAGTVGLLAVFAGLTLIGIGESAAVATAMFFLHVATLTVVCAYSIAYTVSDGGRTLMDNWRTPFPDIVTTDGATVAPGSPQAALFFGYAAALLGITGFETAANYVEEMADARTYVSVLRNMWLAAGFFNPLVALVAQGVLPMADMYANSSNLLAALALKAGGPSLRAFLCIDGTLVLAGSVLTAYVGITGLVRRLALDRVLPPLLLTRNAWRGTNHYIILAFFVLTSSLYLLLAAVSDDANAAMNNLAGVYGISFLSVMSAFALAAMALKWKRPHLPRLVISSWGAVIGALITVLIGLAGTIAKGPSVLGWFGMYFGIVLAIVWIMFERSSLLKAALFIARLVLESRVERRDRKAAEAALLAAHARHEAARGARAAAVAAAATRGSSGSSSTKGGKRRHRQGQSGGGEQAGLSRVPSSTVGLSMRLIGASDAIGSSDYHDSSSDDDGGGGGEGDVIGDDSTAAAASHRDISGRPSASSAASTVSSSIQSDADAAAALLGTADRRGYGFFLSSRFWPWNWHTHQQALDDDDRGINNGSGALGKNGSSSTALLEGIGGDHATTAAAAAAALAARARRKRRRRQRRALALVRETTGTAPLLPPPPPPSLHSSPSTPSHPLQQERNGGGTSDSGGGQRRRRGAADGSPPAINSSFIADGEEEEEGATGSSPPSCRTRLRNAIIRGLSSALLDVNRTPVVYFVKECDLATLNKAVTYVRANEQTQWLLFVHVVDDTAAVKVLSAEARRLLLQQGDAGAAAGRPSAVIAFTDTPSSSNGSSSNGGSGSSSNGGSSSTVVVHGDTPVNAAAAGSSAAAAAAATAAALLLRSLPPPGDNVRLFSDSVAVLDAMYPKLRIDALVVRGSVFSPPVVAWLASYLSTPPSMMFMASPDERFPHQFAAMGGVRVITRGSSRHDRLEQAAHLRRVLRHLAEDMDAPAASY